MKYVVQRNVCLITLLLIMLVPPCAWASDDVEIHGFMSQGYMKSSANNYMTETDEGSYEFNEFGLNFQYFTGDKLSIGAQMGGRDLGTVGNDNVGLNWAYGDYRWREWLGFRAGIMKGVTSLYNETRDVDALRTWILLPQSVYPELTRDASEGLKGVSLYGTVDMASAGILKYTAMTGDLQVSTDSGTAQNIIATTSQISDISAFDFSTLYMGSLKWQTPLEGLLLGTDGVYIDNFTMTIPVITGIGYEDNDPTTPIIVQSGKTDVQVSETKNMAIMFYSLEYTFRNLILAAEMTTSKFKVVTLAGSEDIDNTKWYVSAAYRFLDWFEAGTYYSYSENDSDGSGAENELKDICVTARFDISPHMTFKLETHVMDGLNGVYEDDNGNTDDSWMLYAAKVSYNF